MTIYINKKYGAKIGNIQVFTKERAIEVFKLFAKRCYEDLTIESSSVLSDITNEMNRIGFSYEELEQIEIDITE